MFYKYFHVIVDVGMPTVSHTQREVAVVFIPNLHACVGESLGTRLGGRSGITVHGKGFLLTLSRERLADGVECKLVTGLLFLT